MGSLTLLIYSTDCPTAENHARLEAVLDGLPLLTIASHDLAAWYTTLDERDLPAVQAFIISNGSQVEKLPRTILNRSWRPMIAHCLKYTNNHTASLLDAGFDDVICGELQPMELLARIRAINRRVGQASRSNPVHFDADQSSSQIQFFSDGRDPEISGMPISLRRKERQILEFLVSHQGRRLTRSQIFSAVYGLSNSQVNETTVESHLSNLRARLRTRLGYDPIDSQRFQGYRLSNIAAA